MPRLKILQYILLVVGIFPYSLLSVHGQVSEEFNDKNRYLNLNGVFDLTHNLFDCQLRVEGVRPDFKLKYSTGTVSIPIEKISFNENDAYAEVFTSGKIFGLTVVSLRIPYHDNKKEKFKGMWSGFDPSNERIVTGSLPQFQFDNSIKAVTKIISKKFNSNLRPEERLSPGNEGSYVVYSSSFDSFEKIEIWSNKNKTYVQYQCILP